MEEESHQSVLVGGVVVKALSGDVILKRRRLLQTGCDGVIIGKTKVANVQGIISP